MLRSAGAICAKPQGGDRAPSQGSVSNRPRLCENAQGSTSWRIIFSIALFRIAATALFLFKRTQSRRIFYAQIKRPCFHTAWTLSRPSSAAVRFLFTSYPPGHSGAQETRRKTEAEPKHYQPARAGQQRRYRKSFSK